MVVLLHSNPETLETLDRFWLFSRSRLKLCFETQTKFGQILHGEE